MTPFADDGAYVDILGRESERRARAAYGATTTGWSIAGRSLVALENAYDPENPSRLNRNVAPGP